jgi:membrane fusion protein (multidrug efflux system)
VAIESFDALFQLDLPGEVEGWRDASLAAANGGFVERVEVSAGQEVRTGQRLVLVDSAIHSAGLDQADAQAEAARTELGRLERMGDLATEQQLANAKTQLRVAEASLRQARARASRASVTAPFDGVVADVGVEVGEAAAPGQGVVRLVQLDPVKVSLSVSDLDVVSLRPGLDVTVRTAAAAQTFSGVVRRVAPVADLRTRSFLVEVEVPNPDHHLLPGMIARVSGERPIAQEAVVIPQEWLVTARQEQGVFLEQEGKAVWRPVDLGEVLRDRIVVRSGLAVGDRVIVTGHRTLASGDPVLVARAGTCCAAGRPVFE